MSRTNYTKIFLFKSFSLFSFLAKYNTAENFFIDKHKHLNETLSKKIDKKNKTKLEKKKTQTKTKQDYC